MINKETFDDVATFVPEHTRGCIERYLENKIPTGSFMQAMLEGDSREAHARADMSNSFHIDSIHEWLVRYAPKESHGSREKVSEWLTNE